MKSIIFDKSRGWPELKIIELMTKIQEEVKIVATVRPVNECIASVYKLIRPTEDSEYIHGREQLVRELSQYIIESYNTLRTGYEKYPDKFLLIEYSDLVSKVLSQMSYL